jgi:hypothetical protein
MHRLGRAVRVVPAGLMQQPPGQNFQLSG